MDSYHSYNRMMRRSLLDKAFFLNIIDPDLIVDFGCADGAMLELINTILPDVQLLGYDIDEHMLELARGHVKANFAATWEYVEHRVQREARLGSKTALLCSSVIHEVYSFGARKSIGEFWRQVFDTGFDHIVIRDMMDLYPPQVPIPVDVSDLAVKVHERLDRNGLLRLHDFEGIWGEVTDFKSLRHYLMKYRYRDNWHTEVKENYFSYEPEDVWSRVPKGYRMTMFEPFSVPFLRNQIREHFGFDFPVMTHAKMIFEKVK